MGGKLRVSKQAKAMLQKAGLKPVGTKSGMIRWKPIRMAQIPKSMRPEMKHKEVIIENQNTLILGNQLGPIITCFHTSQGVGVQQRVGLRAWAKGIHIKGHFFNKNGNPAVFIRMLVLQDKEKNDSTFIGDQLLMKAGGMVSHSQGTESAYLPINKNRYQIYSDKLFKLSSSNTNAENVKLFNTFVKLNLPLKYNGTATSDLAQNNIQVVYWAINPSGAVVTVEATQANFVCTAYYNDA